MFDHPVISADGHIDIPCLPATLFTDNAPKRLKDKMPKVVETANGETWIAHNGTSMGLVGGMGSAGREYVPGQIHRADRMASTGLYEDQRKGVMRTTVPELRVRDQERDGVVGEVVYGILGAAFRIDDPEVTDVVVRIYNDFAVDFCRAVPGRFAGVASLPASSPQDTAAEVRRCATLGLKGAELPVRHDMMPLWHLDWDPVWRASHETGLPIHLHTIGPRLDTTWATDRRSRRMWLATVLTEFQIATAGFIGAVIYGGALERYDRCRVVIGEAGIGWIPYVLERMDYEWEDQFQDLELKMKPSEYWYRQMYATFQQDQTGLDMIERVGVDNVMWGSDFPHPDGVWPDSQEFLRKQLAHLSADVRRKLVYDNAVALYGFPPDPESADVPRQ